jgi:hypothetical protein
LSSDEDEPILLGEQTSVTSPFEALTDSDDEEILAAVSNIPGF